MLSDRGFWHSHKPEVLVSIIPQKAEHFLSCFGEISEDLKKT